MGFEDGLYNWVYDVFIVSALCMFDLCDVFLFGKTGLQSWFAMAVETLISVPYLVTSGNDCA